MRQKTPISSNNDMSRFNPVTSGCDVNDLMGGLSWPDPIRALLVDRVELVPDRADTSALDCILVKFASIVLLHANDHAPLVSNSIV